MKDPCLEEDFLEGGLGDSSAHWTFLVIAFKDSPQALVNTFDDDGADSLGLSSSTECNVAPPC